MKNAGKVILGAAGALIAATLPTAATAKAPVASHVEGVPTLLIGTFDVTKMGYTRDEYFVSGDASSYSPVGSLASDGKWKATAAGTAPFRTRIVVMRPADPARFN